MSDVNEFGYTPEAWAALTTMQRYRKRHPEKERMAKMTPEQKAAAWLCEPPRKSAISQTGR